MSDPNDFTVVTKNDFLNIVCGRVIGSGAGRMIRPKWWNHD